MRNKLEKTIVKSFVLGTMTLVMLLASSCSKKETPTIIDDTIVTPIITIYQEPTVMPTPIAMTPAPGVTLTPTALPTMEPTPTPVVLLSSKEAQVKLEEVVDVSKYTYVLSDDHFNLEGNIYYVFIIYENGNEMQPAILVDAKDGKLAYYDMDGNMTEFTKFPVDNTETISSGEYEITPESALQILKKMTKEKLSLVNNISHYEIIMDAWTTVVYGDVCYCFNLYEGREEGKLAGRFYVSTTGTGVYKLDEENGDFVRID